MHKSNTYIYLKERRTRLLSVDTLCDEVGMWIELTNCPTSQKRRNNLGIYDAGNTQPYEFLLL